MLPYHLNILTKGFLCRLHRDWWSIWISLELWGMIHVNIYNYSPRITQNPRVWICFFCLLVCFETNEIDRAEREGRRVSFPCSYGRGSHRLFRSQRLPSKPVTTTRIQPSHIWFSFFLISVGCFLYVSSLSWNNANAKKFELWKICYSFLPLQRLFFDIIKANKSFNSINPF